ncbi:MAG: hypothetical protein PHY93_16935 [Bacteriovorax sp.]|nr:hypothetical protein [Bacteriovorax sp.]
MKFLPVLTFLFPLSVYAAVGVIGGNLILPSCFIRKKDPREIRVWMKLKNSLN